MGLNYTLVDVFSPTAYGGNSLPVFPDARDISGEQMLKITQELRHFEAIFLEATSEPHVVKARVFDLLEELPFAGHPIIGAAAVLHEASGLATAQAWRFQLPGKTVSIITQVAKGGYFGLLDQGTPDVIGATEDHEAVARAFGLAAADLDPHLPLEVISTGLRYLVVPVRPGALARARIGFDITAMLKGINAQFAVLLDEAAVEVRHWNNDGILEDVATGSAAGVIGAYRLRHRLVHGHETFLLRQGRFTGRPSILRVHPEGEPGDIRTIKVGGDVAFVGHGVMEALP